MGKIHINFNALPDDEMMIIAMEVWEGVLNFYTGDSAMSEKVNAAFYVNGASQMREISVAWCAPCWEAWITRETEHFDACFDWEWIPLFLSECIDWTHPRNLSLKPNYEEIAHGFTDGSTAKNASVKAESAS